MSTLLCKKDRGDFRCDIAEEVHALKRSRKLDGHCVFMVHVTCFVVDVLPSILKDCEKQLDELTVADVANYFEREVAVARKAFDSL